jgi:hypothetical protein
MYKRSSLCSNPFFIIYNILTTRCGHKNVQWNEMGNKFRAFIPSLFIPFFYFIKLLFDRFHFLLIFCRVIVKSAPYYLQNEILSRFFLDTVNVRLSEHYVWKVTSARLINCNNLTHNPKLPLKTVWTFVTCVEFLVDKTRQHEPKKSTLKKIYSDSPSKMKKSTARNHLRKIFQKFTWVIQVKLKLCCGSILLPYSK